MVATKFDGGQDRLAGLRELATRAISMDLLPWIDGVWIAGVLVLSFRMLGGWIVLRRLQRNVETTLPVHVSQAFRRLSRSMSVGRNVKLNVSSRISGPVAIGVLRSTILLPVSVLTHLSTEQIEVVLAHELAHIRRADFFWNMIQTVVETLFFFHPAVWSVGGRVRQLREVCCDDAAVEYCGDPTVYASALLQLEEQRQASLHLAMALRGNGKGLKARIGRILGIQRDPGLRRRETVPLTVALVVSLSAIFALLPRPVSAEHGAALAEQSIEKSKVNVRQNVEARTEVVAGVAVSTAVPSASAPQVSVSIHPAVAPVVAVQAQVAASVSPAVRVEAVPALAPNTKTVVVIDPEQIASVSTSVAVKLAESFRAVPPVTPVTAAALLQGDETKAAKEDYIKQMSELGYTDIDKLVAMKVQGITPQYAKSMANVGYGRPSAQELVSLKIFGVTPEAIEKMRTQGVAPPNLQDLIAFSIFKVTPEFAASIKDAGFGTVSPQKLLQLRIQGVTPEYARSIRQRYPDVTIDQLVQLKIFRIDDAFLASAKSHGFDQLSVEKLVKLRISGLLDDNSVKR
jgi:beta-lactamase regulating signal transducer with metallopeptidase domain